MTYNVFSGTLNPAQSIRNRLTDFDEIRTLELPRPLKTTHLVKFHFDPMTWVVSANTQSPLSCFFLCLFMAALRSRYGHYILQLSFLSFFFFLAYS